MKKLLSKIKNWYRSLQPEKYKPSITPTDITPGVGAPKWLQKMALDLSGKFEGCGWGQISGNFDKQGASWGKLQWCIGQGSLQEKIFKPYMARYSSKYTEILHLQELCDMSIRQAKKHIINLMKNKNYVAHAKAFMNTKEVIALQVEAANELGSQAWKLSNLFYGGDSKVAQEQMCISFMWFFDVLVQNGSLKKVKIPTGNLLSDLHKATGTFDFWRGVSTSYFQDQLMVWSYRRAKKSNKKWFEDVLSRKGTIALGYGVVHGNHYNNLHNQVKNEYKNRGI